MCILPCLIILMKQWYISWQSQNLLYTRRERALFQLDVLDAAVKDIMLLCHYLVMEINYTSFQFIYGFQQDLSKDIFWPVFQKMFLDVLSNKRLDGWIFFPDMVWKYLETLCGSIRLICPTFGWFWLSQATFFVNAFRELVTNLKPVLGIYLYLATICQRNYALTKLWKKKELYLLGQKYELHSSKSSSPPYGWEKGCNDVGVKVLQSYFCRLCAKHALTHRLLSKCNFPYSEFLFC